MKMRIGAKVKHEISLVPSQPRVECMKKWFENVEYLEAEYGESKKWNPSDIVKLKEI